MARNSRTAQTPDNQESQPTPSPAPQANPVSLVGPPAQVPERGPTPEIVIGKVEAKPKPEPGPAPVAVYGEDGSITIK